MTLNDRMTTLEIRVEVLRRDFDNLIERHRWLGRAFVTVIIGTTISLVANRVAGK